MNDNILNTVDLIALHDKLNEFAKHHHNLGGIEAHDLIKYELIDKIANEPCDGSVEGRLRNEGCNVALKRVLILLSENFKLKK